MKQHLSKPVTFLNILLLSITIMLSGNALSDEGKKATQAELNAAISTVNTKISDITPPVRAIGEALPDSSIVFWVDETGQHGLAAQPFDEDGVFNWYVAKEVAENHGPGWHLPTKYELNLLFQQKDVVGGFAEDPYWSSTEHDASSAWFQYFFDYGHQDFSPKVNGRVVRAVRAF